LEARDLTVRFDTPEGEVRAVEQLSFTLEAGETLAVVGESGSGKTQAFHALLGLLANNGRASGAALFAGRDLLALGQSALDEIRGRDIALVFQDPMTALNPSLRICRQLTEVLERHQGKTAAQARGAALAMLERVGIPDAPRRLDAYPHQLSGGMRQRVMIAMALLCRPKVLIADEPTTALDVTLQGQILELFVDLKREFGAALVVITHDLGVVAAIADRVMVMYAGRAVEVAPVQDLFDAPRHPYTRALLASTPRIDRDRAVLAPIAGQPPSLQHLPPGCAFHPRCPHAFARCAREVPALEGHGGRMKACFLDEPAAQALEAAR
jgi:oligopeptide transport system ATP-binding protein